MYIDVQTVNHVLNQEVNHRYEDCRHNLFFLHYNYKGTTATIKHQKSK